MKQAQLDEMSRTAARLERDLQPGRWDDSVPDEEASVPQIGPRVTSV